MFNIEMVCPKCGRNWEYGQDEFDIDIDYDPKKKVLIVEFMEYELLCECGHIVGSEE